MARVQHTKQTIKQQSNLQEVVSVGGQKEDFRLFGGRNRRGKKSLVAAHLLF